MKKSAPLVSVFSFPRCLDGALPCFVPVFRALNIINVRAASTCLRHQHHGFEVIFVERGPYHYSLNNEKWKLNSGKILVVKPGDWHEDYYTPPLRFFAIVFDLGKEHSDHSAFPIFADDVKPEYQRLQTQCKELWSVLARIRGESEIADSISAHVQDALVQEFFWLLMRALPKEALSPWFFSVSSRQAFATELMRLFHRHITTKLPLARMAGDMHMSKSALAHTCRTFLQVPPAKAFMKYKMERAYLLVQHTSMSIKEISAYLGFENPYHFSRLFKRYFKKPPSLAR